MPVVGAEERDVAGREREDVLAAVAGAAEKGVSLYTVASALSSFRRPEYRREECGKVAGVRMFNDSKATNPDSTIKAIQAMTKPTVLILGGSNKNSDYMPMFRAFTKYIQSIVVVGETSEQILSAALKAGFIIVNRAYTC